MTTRVLFVDDETRVLEGLQRMLRSRRHEWEMEFASDAASALEACARKHFDVVVSDMRMPGMDGADLLTELQKHHPRTVRIVLSGHADRVGAARAARVAHQLLTKPTDATGLTETIDRACRLRDRLADPSISRLLEGGSWLTEPPPVYRNLLETMGESGAPQITPGWIAAREDGTAARALDLLNSTAFGASRHVPTLQTAITLLGADFVASLILAAEVFRSHEEHHGAAVTEPLRRHSLLVADLAASVVNEGHRWESAYIAGLLHEFGTLARRESVAGPRSAADGPTHQEDADPRAARTGLSGETQARLGACLLRRWNLPEAVVEAVAFHRSPSSIGVAVPMVPLAVHVADHLAHEAAGDTPPVLDVEALRDADLEDRLGEWRALAAERL